MACPLLSAGVQLAMMSWQLRRDRSRVRAGIDDARQKRGSPHAENTDTLVLPVDILASSDGRPVGHAQRTGMPFGRTEWALLRLTMQQPEHPGDITQPSWSAQYHLFREDSRALRVHGHTEYVSPWNNESLVGGSRGTLPMVGVLAPR